MSLDRKYDDQNIFAKIIRGEMPKVAVYEDSACLAFMDVFPQSEGHVLVISKTAKSANILDLDADELKSMITVVQKISKAVEKALTPAGIRIAQFNGEAAGQTVFHTHFHVIPAYEGQTLARHGEGMAQPDELEAIAKKIRHAL